MIIIGVDWRRVGSEDEEGIELPQENLHALPNLLGDI